MVKHNQNQTLQTAVRTAKTLTFFSDNEPELSVSRLCELLEVPISTASRILASLKLVGLVEQDPQTKHYSLSWKVYLLGNTVLNMIGIGSKMDAAMRTLADLTKETVNVGVRSVDRVIYIRKLESSEILKADTPVGSSVPLHCTALGKMLLANLNKEIKDELLLNNLTRFTENTIVNPRKLNQEFDLIRERGFAFDNEEFVTGVGGIACAIRNSKGDVVAGLSIGAPISRLTETRLETFLPHLIEQAEVISKSLR